MAPKQDADIHTASIDDKVRLEIQVRERKYVHEVGTEVLLDGHGIARKGDEIRITIDVLRLTLRRKAAAEIAQRMLHLVDDDAKWSVIEPVLRDLEGKGFRPRS